MIDRDVIEAVRERTDLVQVVSQVVSLRRRGSSWVGLCPFHREKTPSFHVVPAKGIWHCFGCGEGGDVFAFVQRTRGLDFVDAVKELAQAAGVRVPERELSPDERRRLRARATLHEVCDAACRFYQAVLLARPEGRPAREYLASRGIDEETIRRYRLGASPPSWTALLDHLHREGYPEDLVVAAGIARRRPGGRGAYDLFRGRVIVPIEDARGRVVGFGGRVVPGVEGAREDAPKYVNSPETEIYRKSRVLYGLPHARSAIQRTGRVLVVEGYFDVLSLHRVGVREAVATCGTALTPEHARILRPLAERVYAVFDTDEAGLRAAARSLETFLVEGIEPFRLDLSPHKDPDDFVRAVGAEGLEERFAAARPLFDLVVDRLVERHGRTPGGIARVVDAVAPLLDRMEGVAAEAAVQRVARRTGLSEGAIRDRLARGRSPGAPAPATPPPARWQGTRRLRHLLWLLLHHLEEVAPVLVEEVPDPTIVSERESVQRAIALLLAGTPLPEVVEEVDDPDLGRVLLAAAAREGLYERDHAAAAARQIVARMHLDRIDAELSALARELAGCTSPQDETRYFSLLRRRQQLQRDKSELRRRLAGGGR